MVPAFTSDLEDLPRKVFASGIPIVMDIEAALDGTVWVSSVAQGTPYRISRR